MSFSPGQHLLQAEGLAHQSPPATIGKLQDPAAAPDGDQRPALMQFFKPENYFEVRKTLEPAGRSDLIGGGCDCLIPAHPPKEALTARRRRANEAARGDHVHTVANPTRPEGGLPVKGYRPGRKGARRQNKHR